MFEVTCLMGISSQQLINKDRHKDLSLQESYEITIHNNPHNNNNPCCKYVITCTH